MGRRNHHLSTAQLLNEALRHHQSGRLGEAAAGYQEILQQNPKHSDALHLLGVVAQQMDKLDMAIELMKAAVAVNPSVAHYHHNLGNTYLKNRQAAEAVNCYRQAILLKPEYFEAHFGIGNALAELNQVEVAAEAYQTAVALQPSFAEGHYNLGRMLSKLDKVDAAVAAYRTAIRLDGKHPEFFFNLGNILRKKEDYACSIEAYRSSLALNSSDAECLNNLGLALAAIGESQEAEQAYRRSLSQTPDYPECWSNLGKLFSEQKRFLEVAECFERAIALNPEDAASYFYLGIAQLELKEADKAEKYFREALQRESDLPEAYFNLGNILRADFRLQEAIECFRRAQETKNPTYRFQAIGNRALSLNEVGEVDAAIDAYHQALEIEPDNAITHCNLAYTLLLAGRWDEGWSEHEWRWKLAGTAKPRGFVQPLWKGEPLHGKRILLHAEQGFGDTIQFVRYVPLILERGGRVILDVQSNLRRLLSGFPGVEQIISTGEALPEFDYHCPFLSLPLVFKTTPETVPAAPSYLSVPPDVVEATRNRWPGQGLRVGLVWSGHPRHVLDAHRSMRLKDMRPLSAVPGVSFYSLQVGQAAEQISDMASTFPVIDVCSGYTDFADTSAFVAGLDLVITVDTSVAHLAGALGRPVWILLAHNRLDWRWLRDRSDTPWYPSACIFRQPQPNDWAGLIETVTLRLKEFVAEHNLEQKQTMAATTP